MTDLEMTRLCAEAMGLVIRELPVTVEESIRAHCVEYQSRHFYNQWLLYDPLHEDEQAMALVKKCRLGVTAAPCEYGTWAVSGVGCGTLNESLNRAICECVAKMQQARAGK